MNVRRYLRPVSWARMGLSVSDEDTQSRRMAAVRRGVWCATALF